MLFRPHKRTFWASRSRAGLAGVNRNRHGRLDDDDPPDDRRLLADHVAGDPQAFGEIVRRHRDRLWSVAWQTLRNPDDADDALQTGLERAFKNANTFRGDAAVAGWLYRIITNAALDQVLKGPRGITISQRDPADLDTSTPDTTQDLFNVSAALNNLPLDLRAAFFLVAYLGFTQKEAAHLLDVPQNTIKTWVARARVRLVEYLDGIEDSSESEA